MAAFTRRPLGRLLPALAAGLVALLPAAASAVPSDWAAKMFTTTSHNFGTVAKGSKTEHRFVFRNIYKEDLHVVGVRTSCGCTSPTVTKKDLKTHETAEVVASFNTRTFQGQQARARTTQESSHRSNGEHGTGTWAAGRGGG